MPEHIKMAEEKKEKIVVSDYFGQSEFDMHIVDMFMKVLHNNGVAYFGYDSSNPEDVKVSIVDRDTLAKVQTESKEKDVNKELESTA